MERFVCLLRGVNVGGAGTRLSMADMRAGLAAAGAVEIATYIQSGNAVFLSAETAATLAERIGEALTLPNGKHPVALVLPLARLAAARAANPYPAAEARPKSLHLVFGDRPVGPDAAAMAALAAADEGWACAGDVLYLHTPSGFGTSRLAGRLERLLRPAVITARNLATVDALIALGGRLPG